MGQITGVTLVALAFVLTGSEANAQKLSTVAYVGAGPGSSGASVATGAGIEVGSNWGAYARLATRAVFNSCLTSLPARCNYPSGQIDEYALGVFKAWSEGSWQPRVMSGGGLISWQGKSDPFAEVNGELRRSFANRLSLAVGVHSLIAPGVERPPNGDKPIVSRRTVVLTNVIVGIAIRVW
jgi:hypothetical protein